MVSPAAAAAMALQGEEKDLPGPTDSVAAEAPADTVSAHRAARENSGRGEISGNLVMDECIFLHKGWRQYQRLKQSTLTVGKFG